MNLIEPKSIDIDGREYIISKFSAIAGREILAKYSLSSIPKVGDYKTNEEIMLKLMCYVGVPIDPTRPLMLTTQSLIDNHVPNWEILAKLEMATLEYNCSFFQNGRVSTFLTDIAQKLPSWISRILTDLSPRSSVTEKLP